LGFDLAWFTFELPKVNAAMQPIYLEMGLLPARDFPSNDLPSSDIDLISDVQESAI
jgi:hypothetical protein